MGSPDTQIGAGQSQFPPTAWTLLAQLRDPQNPAFRVHLESLTSLYWRPIYKYIRIAWKRSNEDAKDLTQTFFVQLMEGTLFERANPERGNFRKLLLAALRNFLINVERGARAAKRGGGRPLIPLTNEVDIARAPESSDPNAEFDSEWAREILERSIGHLRQKVRPQVFQAFDLFHLKGMPVKDIARTLGATETQVAHHLQDARNSLRILVMEEIRQYVVDEQELIVELESLFQGWR